jgi:aminopeptidase N
MLIPLLLLLQDAAPPAPAIHTAHHYEITLVPADTGTHLLGEVQTSWTLGSADAVAALLDSTMRVVRVLVDGKPNTRISRTMYGRSGQDVVVPHQKVAGDSISTRIRYHGLVTGGAWLGDDRGSRAFVAGGWGGLHHWLPVPPGPPQRVSATFNVQATTSQRVVANGVLTRIDTLPYDHVTWHYRLDSAAPLASLAVAVGPYAVTALGSQVELWTRPADSAWAEAGPFRRAGQMVEHLSRTLGPLSYARLAHVAAPAVPAPAAGGGLALYPAAGFREGGVEEVTVARATALQWLDGADSAVAGEIADWLAAEWAGGGPPREPRRLSELRSKLGDPVFRRGLQAFVRAQREGRGSAEDFAATMQPGR